MASSSWLTVVVVAVDNDDLTADGAAGAHGYNPMPLSTACCGGWRLSADKNK